MRYIDWPTHPAALDPEELRKQCRLERGRATGPGGQRRDKVETAVRLRHEETGVEASAGERRSAAENEQQALRRLRLELALALRVPWNSRRAPSSRWRRRRRRDGRLEIRTGHADFPALLAEALDAAVGFEDDLSAAAQALGVSTSQMVRLLAMEPRGLAAVNQRRRDRGLHAFR